jgi:prepilin-type processing-associated H-X9-DG protein/prepilin-type N-terminal cleavage/methylation domain-containing protein
MRTTQLTGRRGARAFTLTELLIVIGILVVLAAMLFPAVSRVREHAWRATCLSQVRQLDLAYMEYLRQSDQAALGYDFTPTSSWVTVLRARLDIPEQVYRCPSAPDERMGFGSANASWTLVLRPDSGPVTVTGSYGFNAWLLTWDPKSLGGDLYSGGTQSEHVRGLGAHEADRIPVFGDCTWQDSWPRETDPRPPNLLTGDRRHQGWRLAPNENFMARFTIARHDKSVNMAFLDGHAEAVALDDLKQLKWHEGFVYQSWSPALPNH